MKAVVDLLVRDFAASRIVLFGSFARDEAKRGSDLDLLVEGLATANLIDATVAIQRVLGDVDVDLVPIQLARAEVLQRITQEGQVLYEVAITMGGLPAGNAWHRQLRRDATLNLPKLRPPILTEASAKSLEPFLAFRLDRQLGLHEPA